MPQTVPQTAAAAPRADTTIAPELITEADLIRTPLWYNGDKPWRSITREGRIQMLQMHAAFAGQQQTAREAPRAATVTSASDDAAAGEALIKRTVRKYNLDPVHERPDTFGSSMVIWLPERAWNSFTPAQKASVEAYMRNQYANWGIGVGRVKGRMVLLDRLVVEH